MEINGQAYGGKSNYYKLIRNLVEFTNTGFNLKLNFNHYMFHRPSYVNSHLVEYLKTLPNKNGIKLRKSTSILLMLLKKFLKILLSPN